MPGCSPSVENLLEMLEKAKLNDEDMIQLINGLVGKLHDDDLKHSAMWTQVNLSQSYK